MRTVSMPRCTSTPGPCSERIRYACACSLTRRPSIGATAVCRPGSGSIATPGPTMPDAKTGSGTSLTSWLVPAIGESTQSFTTGRPAPPPSAAGPEELLDLRGDRVGARSEDHLDDRSRTHHSVRPGLPECGLVHQGGVSHLGAQPGDAGLDLHDVAVTTEPRHDLMGLAHDALNHSPPTARRSRARRDSPVGMDHS